MQDATLGLSPADEEARDSVEDIGQLPLVTRMGATVPLDAVARLEIADGPPMLKSENARPNRS